MPDRSRRRAGRHRIAGRQRANDLARRLGVAVRERREAQAATQGELGGLAGVSQAWWSKAERGHGRVGSLETWASVAAAVGGRLVVFIEDSPSSDRPRDFAHLIRQELVIRTAALGGWLAAPEHALAAEGPERWRYVDVLLQRPLAKELAVVEIWNLLADVGDGLRGLRTRVDRLRREYPDWTLSGLLVLRATARNRRLATRLAALFAASVGGPSSGWLRALTDPTVQMPNESGLVWTDVAGTRIFASRLRPGMAKRFDSKED